MNDIRYDRGGNYADYVYIDSQEAWMSVDLDPRALLRVDELGAAAGNDLVFLSFSERVDWARSEATIEQAVEVIEQRKALPEGKTSGRANWN